MPCFTSTTNFIYSKHKHYTILENGVHTNKLRCSHSTVLIPILELEYDWFGCWNLEERRNHETEQNNKNMISLLLRLINCSRLTTNE